MTFTHRVFRYMLLLSIPLTSGSFVVSHSAYAEGKLDSALRNECIQLLQSSIRTADFWPAMHAAEALSQNGHQAEVREVLTPRLPQATDLRQRCGVARELVRAGDKSQTAVLLEVLANADSYGHTHACESLFKVSQAGDGKLLQAAMANDAAPVTALMAAAALVRQGDANALARVRSELQKSDSETKWVAAWILGALGNEQDLPALTKCLAETQVAKDRPFFENALGLLGDANGKRLLLANLKHPTVSVRADAAYMVGDAGFASAQPQLIEMLKDDDVDVTIRAAQGLLALDRQTHARGQQVTARKPGTEIVPPTAVLDLQPGPNNSRNSEGDTILTKDGRLLFIYTYFQKGSGSDYDRAELRERVSTDGGKTWLPDERTVVKAEGGLNVMSVSLLRLQTGEIALFYLYKVSHSDCRPELRISTDEGKTWGSPIQCITDLVDYYVLNNARAIQLKSGRIVLPVCLHRTVAPNKNDWAGELMCYFSDDNGKTWKRSESVFKGTLPNGKRATVQEPGVVELKDGRVMMFIRANAGSQMLSYSEDGGNTWSDPVTSEIKSPLSPASMKRIPKTGDLLLVWNNHDNIPKELSNRRTPLTVAISKDEGKTWTYIKNLYDDPEGWYCYMSIDFVDDAVLVSHCAGNRVPNGLVRTKITRFNLDWLYSDSK